MAKGRELPAWFLEEPELFHPEGWYIKAFWELSTERQWGTILGPIPRSAIRDFGRERGFDDSTLELLLTVVRALDAGYLDWMRSEHDRHVRANAPTKQPKAQAGRSARGRRARRS